MRAEVNAVKLCKHITMEVKVRRGREASFRLWLAKWLIWLAAWIGNLGFDWNDSTDD